MKIGITVSLLLIFVITSCSEEEEVEEERVEYDLEEIVESDTIIAVTSYSPTSYFLYRGEPMGYNYEMLTKFAEHLDIDLEMRISRSLSDMFEMLETGEIDLIAHNLTVTGSRARNFAFTKPLNNTRQVLVQAKPDNWRNMPRHEIDQQLIRSPLDLAGKSVYVRQGSAYEMRLQHLSEEIGADIDIQVAPDSITSEELISKVADGEIDYTVTDKNLASINESYYPILDIQTEISLPQNLAWAVRKQSEELLAHLNEWLESFQRQTDYYVIYNKYFENRTAYRTRMNSDLLSIHSGRFSWYDGTIQRYSDQIGWDWKLLAALIFEESRFNPNARSGAGATGLMQLMPRTARSFGANNPQDPEQSIRAGTQFIEWLSNYWEREIEDDEQRMKFILASYNTGQGHVQDARRLAREFGDADPDIWTDNVERYMLKKSEREYFNHEVVRHGYSRGQEPVNYVNRIMYIYDHYQMVAAYHEDEPEAELAWAR